MNVEVFNTVKDVFSNIYDKKLWIWGSGHGSLPATTISYRNILIDVIKSNDIKTVLDYGCGDWQFSKLIDWNNLVDSYLGVDIVPSVIEKIQVYANDKIKFELLTPDWTFPQVDLIICKDVFMHLPNSMISDLLDKMKPSSKFMLITNNHGGNSEGILGDCRGINMKHPPWNLEGHEYEPLKEFNGITDKRTILIKNSP